MQAGWTNEHSQLDKATYSKMSRGAKIGDAKSFIEAWIIYKTK